VDPAEATGAQGALHGEVGQDVFALCLSRQGVGRLLEVLLLEHVERAIGLGMLLSSVDRWVVSRVWVAWRVG
jgi:hypothetical protein